jgi:hypothetical protein
MNKLLGNEKFWIAILLLLVLPFIVLSFFVHPSADDYILSAIVKDVGRWNYLKSVYNIQSGRYAAHFILSYNPLVFGWDFGYRLIPIFLIVLFYHSIYCLVKNIISDAMSIASKHLITLIFLLIYLNNIPSTTECIYWMTSSLIYFLPSILTIYTLALLAKTQQIDKDKPIIHFGIIFLIIAIIGMTEINMFFLIEFMSLIILYEIFIKKHLNRNHLICWVIILLASIFEISAPGNYQRMQAFPEHYQFFFAVKESLFAFVKISVSYIQSPSFIITTLIFISFLPTILGIDFIKKITNFSPFILLPLSILILISLYFPVIFSTGMNPALRVHNTIALYFVLAWFFNIGNLYQYLLKKNKITVIEVPSYLTKLLSAAAIILTITQFTKEPGKEIICEGNIFHTYYDLFLNATRYNQEMNSREYLIRQAVDKHKKSVDVPRLTAIPKTIYFIDITKDASYWVNQCEAKYFGIDSIRIEKTASDSIK